MSELATKSNFISLKYHSPLLIIVVLAITTLVLVWSAASREKEYIDSQRNMSISSVDGVANQISNKISDLRQSVKLFAQKERDLLVKVVKEFDNLDAYDKLVEITKKEFPNAVAITVADQLGEPYIEDFDGFILDICLRDIKTFSGMRHPPEVFIHPNPLAYHFDIMVKVDIGLGEQTIFFVSFSPELISRILNNGELYSHKLYLLKDDPKGLVEVTAKGARDLLPVDKLYLTEEEKSQIIYSRKVPNTAWKLIDRPVNDYISEHCREIWNETIFMVSLLVTFSLLMFYLQHRTERKAKRKTDAALQQKVAAEDASKAKSQFLANMSHEIRTPLTAIIGYGETLLRSDQSVQDRVDSVNTIISSGEHLLNLINDILDVSKIEAQKLVLESTQISPYKIINEVERIISGQAKRKGVNFSIDYDFPLPSKIVSDEIRVKQILLNLCSNAVKFTDKGYIRFSMRYEKSLDRLYFIVQDSGIGMTEENMRLVFDDFTQADSSTTRKYGGTGLGLSLSKQLALLLGGDIDVDSKLGIGSTFALHIPTNLKENISFYYDENDIPIFKADLEGQYGPEKLTGNVLIAEDNINNQKLIKYHLEKMGLNVTAVDNGKQALNKASSETFDLIFMDMQMPVMGGLETVEKLRKNGYEKPIVALTANALQEDKEKCLNAGCNDYATKPIHYDQLYQIARQYVQIDTANSGDAPLYSTILGEEDYEDLINRFILSLEPTKNKLKLAYREQAWELLTEMIHQLKGLGGGYGFPDISDVAAKIEFQLISKNYYEAGNLLNNLYSLFERAIAGHRGSDNNTRNVAGI